MYWLGRPPYLRWIAAVVVLAVGLFAEFRPTTTTHHPFAATDIGRGTQITDVEWRRVPRGFLAQPDLTDAFAAVDVPKGEPLLASHVAPGRHVPPSWWSVPVPMPFSAPIGTAVRLVDALSQRVTDGIIVAEPADDPFAVQPSALIAVPPDAAAAIAVAAGEGRVTVLLAAG